jgi:uncharacterized protein involved in outer membrane biogenesis
VRVPKRTILIAAVVLLVVLPAAAALLVRVLLTPEMLKAAVERQGSQWLGRAITVGSARAQLLPRTGITLTQVTVDGEPRLTAEEVVVGTSLRGLLSKRIAGAVVRVRDGRLALGDAASQRAPRSASGQPSATRDRSAGAPVPTPAASGGAQQQDPSGFTIDSVSEIVVDNVVVSGGGKQLRLDLDGALSGDTFEVARVAVSSGATSMHGTGTVTSVSRRDGTFSMQSPLIDVDEVLAVLAALVPADPAATGMSALAGEEASGMTFGHVTGRIKVERGQALGYDVSRLEGGVEIKGTMLTARPLAFDLYGGRYESTLELDLATNRIALSHDAALTGTSVGKLVELFGNAGAATGGLGLTMRVRGAGKDFQSAARHVSGAATVRITDGTIAGLDVVRQAFTLLGTAPLEGTQGERFESISASLGVASGTLSTDDFVLHSPDFDLNGRLRIDPDGRIAGDADLMLSDALSAEAQSKNRDLKLAFEGRRVTLPVTIGGTLTNPRVFPDINDALRRAARNRAGEEIDKAKKKAGDELKRGLDRLLKP